MKQAVIFSDSHGRIDPVLDVMKQYPKAEAFFHLGDIEGDDDRMRRATPYPVYIVKGNCDYFGSLPEQLVIDFAGKKIAMCHGHRQMPYGVTDMLRYWGMEQKADIVMFGHIHTPLVLEEDGLFIVNPGSIAKPRQEGHIPTYCVMEIDDDGRVTFEIKNYIKGK